MTFYVLFPCSALPPGTPIAFSPAPFTPTAVTSQGQGQGGQGQILTTHATQQAIYRIPTAATPGQVLSLPGKAGYHNALCWEVVTGTSK